MANLSFVAERELFVATMDRPAAKGDHHQSLLWGGATGLVRTPWDGEEFVPRTGTATPDGRTLVLVSCDRIEVRELPGLELRHRMRAPRDTDVSYADLIAAGSLLAASCRQERDDYAVAAVWDLERGKRLRVYDLEEGQTFIDAVAVCPASRRLAFAVKGRLRCFGMEDEEDLEGFKPFEYESLQALRYGSEGALEAVADRHLVRLDPATGERVTKWKILSVLEWERAAFDPMGEKLALSAGTTVEVLDVPD